MSWDDEHMDISPCTQDNDKQTEDEDEYNIRRVPM